MARPVGSTTRPQKRTYMNKKDIKEMLAIAVKKAKAGDVRLLQFLLEQYFGKAQQNIGLDAEGKLKVLLVSFVDGEDTNNKDEDTR